MKFTFSVLLASILFVSCKSNSDSVSNEAFEKNSKTVLNYMNGVQNEKMDYSGFSKDFKSLGTLFGAKDTISLDEFKANDKMLLANFNLKLIGGEPIFLPGVNSVTKMPDGSVRNYSTWEISTEKTDSTEAKSAKFKLYQSYDFDADGKIIYEQSYGDLSAVIMYLSSK